LPTGIEQATNPDIRIPLAALPFVRQAPNVSLPSL
jgi:hypothetical protein